jgi:hypothetical protein
VAGEAGSRGPEGPLTEAKHVLERYYAVASTVVRTVKSRETRPARKRVTSGRVPQDRIEKAKKKLSKKSYSQT